MSNFHAITRNPDSGEFERAEWLDNYFGAREYGIRFPSSGKVFRESEQEHWALGNARDLTSRIDRGRRPDVRTGLDEWLRQAGKKKDAGEGSR